MTWQILGTSHLRPRPVYPPNIPSPIFDRLAKEMDMTIGITHGVPNLFARHGHHPWDMWPCDWRP